LLSSNIKKIQKTIVAETTALAGSTTESLRNIELIKSSGLADEEILRLNGITTKILKLELKMVRYVRSLSFVQGTVVNFLRNCILFLLAFLVISGKIKLGEMFSLFFYSFAIFNPLQELGNIISVYRLTEASLDNYSRILAIPIEEKPVNPARLGVIASLEFKEVNFRHNSGTRNALSNISFKAEKGETIAFVGPSGAGKTTLVKLLVGLYHPNSGNVYYDGIDSSELDLEKLQKRIGFVTQDTQLFAGTIRENLLFVKPTATDKECIFVLEKAACRSLLERADQGLDTIIGEGGVKVSGGEKQRLSIARSLLRNPEIMIFDEATSSLDSITEEEINSTIRDVSQSNYQITIMIAHRLSTIMHSDKIFVLERGKIIETGKHEELVALRGLYYAMWRQQIGEKEAEVEYLN
jgi:ATP-binding cassette subfamily B protein